MPDDAEFIAQILACPGDDGPRLVYADWLDEQGDVRGHWLRMTCELAHLPEGSTRRPLLQRQIRLLAIKIDPDWRASVSRAPIENCRAEFSFECPKQWEQIQKTDDARIRTCESCGRDVFFCDTISQAHQLASRGECVALDSRIVRRSDDLTPRPRLVLGIMHPSRSERVERREPPSRNWINRLFGRGRKR
jgi:uncharacterized protein (TIGR02996 family)